MRRGPDDGACSQAFQLAIADLLKSNGFSVFELNYILLCILIDL